MQFSFSPVPNNAFSSQPQFDKGATPITMYLQNNGITMPTMSPIYDPIGMGSGSPSIFSGSGSMLPTNTSLAPNLNMLSALYQLPTPNPQPPLSTNPNPTDTNAFYNALALTPNGGTGTETSVLSSPLLTQGTPLPTPTPTAINTPPTNNVPPSSQLSFLAAALPKYNPATIPPPTTVPTPTGTGTPINGAANTQLMQIISTIQQLLGGGVIGGNAPPANNNVLVDAEKIKILEEASNKQGVKGKVLENGGGPDNLIGNNDLDSIIKNGKKSGLDDKTIALAKEMKAVLAKNPKASWLSS